MPQDLKPSPLASTELMEAIATGGSAEEAMGETDCPSGCYVEPDGECSHGYLSAGRTAGVI